MLNADIRSWTGVRPRQHLLPRLDPGSPHLPLNLCTLYALVANEAPLAAARREVAEELGIAYRGGRLLVVDWVGPHGPWDDSLAFVFDGGVMLENDQARIRLLDGELNGYRSVAPGEASRMLRPYVESRIREALDATNDGTARYLNNGRPV